MHSSNDATLEGLGDRNHAVLAILQRALLGDARLRRFRINRLVDTVMSSQEPGVEEDAEVLEHLCLIVQKFSSFVAELDDISQRMVRIFEILADQLTLTASTNVKSLSNTGGESLETCDICESPISCRNPYSATCSRGHKFGRKSLTRITSKR